MKYQYINIRLITELKFRSVEPMTWIANKEIMKIYAKIFTKYSIIFTVPL
jgi:hypothetical protein